MSKYHIKNVDWVGAFCALLIAVFFLVFPFINPCEAEDSALCTWNADIAGNGTGDSFTDFYGITLYLP